MFLDRMDKAILRQLQRDAAITNLQLAEIVGLSAPACLKRVKRLQKEGVIQRQVALLNPDSFGPCLHILVEVTMQSDRRELNAAFIQKLKHMPQVKQCYEVTGEVDFVLLVQVPDMPSYQQFCEALLYSNPNMKAFTTLISMNRIKYDTSLTIAD